MSAYASAYVPSYIPEMAGRTGYGLFRTGFPYIYISVLANNRGKTNIWIARQCH